MRFLLSVLVLILSSLVHATSIDKIVAFGDSLSDNGNLYQITEHFIPNSPPYFNGRFTNGPVWVEVLAESYYKENSSAHLLDYAFGGADISEGVMLPNLKNQIGLYLNAHQEKANGSSLYIIWIGANNYVNMPEEEVEQTVAKVNRGIKKGVESLIQSGAKHIMLVNLPDLGLSPMPDEVVYEDKSAEEVRDLLSQYCQKHNMRLAETVSELQEANQGVDVLLFDANAEINNILGQFKNVTQSCYATRIDHPTTNITAQIAAKIKLPHAHDEKICEDFLFFDALHPTVKVHRIFAAKAKEFLAENKIEFSSLK